MSKKHAVAGLVRIHGQFLEARGMIPLAIAVVTTGRQTDKQRNRQRDRQGSIKSWYTYWVAMCNDD